MNVAKGDWRTPNWRMSKDWAKPSNSRLPAPMTAGATISVSSYNQARGERLADDLATAHDVDVPFARRLDCALDRGRSRPVPCPGRRPARLCSRGQGL